MDEAHEIDAVAHFAAQQLVNRHAQRLAVEIPQRHLDPRVRGPMMRQRRVHLAVERFDVERRLAQHRRGQMSVDVDSDPLGGLAVGSGRYRGLPHAGDALIGDQLHHDRDRRSRRSIGSGQRRGTGETGNCGADFDDLHEGSGRD